MKPTAAPFRIVVLGGCLIAAEALEILTHTHMNTPNRFAADRMHSTAVRVCVSLMIADCGLFRGAMRVRSKYLTVLREEATSARQQQGGSRRLAALSVAVGDGRDIVIPPPPTVLFPISYSYTSNDSTRTEVTQRVRKRRHLDSGGGFQASTPRRS